MSSHEHHNYITGRALCRNCHVPVDIHEYYADDVLIRTEFEHSAAYVKLGLPPHEVEPMIAREFDEMIGICDFCGAPGPYWLYNTNAFTQDQVLDQHGWTSYNSDEGWMACNDCHALIEVDDFDTLLRRFAERTDLAEKSAMVRRLVLRDVAALWAKFRANRLGPPTNVLRTD